MTKPLTIPFGQRLRQLLGDRTGAWLAKTSGLGIPAISRLRSGHRLPSAKAIMALAIALGLSPEDLIEGTDVADRVIEPSVHRGSYEAVVAALAKAQAKIVDLEIERAQLKRRLAQQRKRFKETLRTLVRSL